jgi:hypothetical protein
MARVPDGIVTEPFTMATVPVVVAFVPVNAQLPPIPSKVSRESAEVPVLISFPDAVAKRCRREPL